MGYGNVNVANTATEILAQNKRRTSLKIRHNGTNAVFLGTDNSVTTANGFPLSAGETFTISLEVDKESIEATLYTGTIFGIVASGTEDVRYFETDDTSDTRET